MKIRYLILAIIIGFTALHTLPKLVRAEDDERSSEQESDDVRPVILTPTTAAPSTAAPTTLLVTPVQTATPVAPSATAATTSLSHTQAGTPWAWYITRAAGIASLILLILVAITGIGVTTGVLFRYLAPTRAWWWHRAISIALIFSILTHVTALLFDHYINFSLKDILIPFATSFRTTYVALGIISLYLFIVITLTSLFWIQSKSRLWRLLHYLTFVMFILVFVHSILIGTDTRTVPMLILYWGSGLAFFGLALYRLYNSSKRHA